MATEMLPKIQWSSWMLRGHQVQNDLEILKVYDSLFIVQKLCHCAPKIGEITAISIHHVNDKILLGFEQFARFLSFTSLRYLVPFR